MSQRIPPDNGSSSQPNAQRASYDVLSWLAHQEHGFLDPEIYSDRSPPMPYPTGTARPPHYPSANNLYPPSMQQQPMGGYTQQLQVHPAHHPPVPPQNHGPYTPAFQHGSSIPYQQQPPVHMARQYSQGSAGAEEGSISSYGEAVTDPEGADPSAGSQSTIPLDWTQPLTVDGKPRKRVYLACDPCRQRKFRCDGARPVCYNCQHRTDPVECSYESVPRRRGQDKAPRVRSPVGVRQPRKPAPRKGDVQRDSATGQGSGHHA